MGWWAGLLVPTAAAAAVTLLAPKDDRAAIAPTAVALALGVSSLMTGALLFAGVRARAFVLGSDLAAWLAIALLAMWTRRPVPPVLAYEMKPPPSARWLTIAAAVLLASTAVIAISSFVAASAVYPHGEWDAWAQWNLRSRFFFRGLTSGEWRNAFAPVLAWSHADYPPLVPLAVARLWLFAGTDLTAAPIAVAASMSATAVAAAGFGAARYKGAARGCLAAAAVLGCPSFVRYAAAQCADIPLSAYILASFVLWSFAEAPRGRVWLALAGCSAALGAFTKNEGIPFLALFVVLVAVDRLRRFGLAGWRDLVAVGAGIAPVIVLILFYKARLAPPSYFVAEQTLQQAIDRLLDGGRARVVGLAVLNEVWRTGAKTVGVLPGLALFLAVRGVDKHAPMAARTAAPMMIVMLLIYSVAYLVTPKDLVWQLKTSLDRLVVQLVPTLAWSVVTLAK